MFELLLFGLLFIGPCSNDEGDGEKDEDTVVIAGKSGDERTLTIAVGSDVVMFQVHDHINTSTAAKHVNRFN